MSTYHPSVQTQDNHTNSGAAGAHCRPGFFMGALKWVRSTRLGALRVFFLFGLLLAFLIRCGLTGMCWSECESGVLSMLAVFATGFLFDVAALMYFFLPFALYLFLMPQCWFAAKWNRRLFWVLGTLMALILIFSGVAEFFFWDEFGSRFNFIAVDYLIYTTEVLGNIWQSYNIPLVFGGIGAAVALTLWGLVRSEVMEDALASDTSWGVRIRHMVAYLTAVGCFTAFLSYDTKPAFNGNAFSVELAGNGIYSFFAAARHNQLDYKQFYRTMDEVESDRIVREYLAPGSAGAQLSTEPGEIARVIENDGGAEHKYNVIVVLEESFSAHFTGVLGNPGGMSNTPRFDELSKDGLLLERCFASGTRTVRGIEAVTLSAPPTPGQSIVKRPWNGDLPCLGAVFKERGYRNTFIYGGNGFFDNMNAYFSANGYEIVDEMSPHERPPRFSNIWGVCDQDLFQWALEEADKAHAAGEPFHHFILTTSNHRPYTFPEGTIDAPQKQRSSAVRYMDYSLCEFIELAKEHPWFSNTIFVVVADHCQSTSGRSQLPLNKYHIPAFFYAPGLIQPGRISSVCSQIDIAPTIFGILNWRYVSSFYGRDVRKVAPGDGGRAFPGTFQNLGYLDGATGIVTTLSPRRGVDAQRWNLVLPIADLGEVEPPQADTVLATAIYQNASRRFARMLRENRKRGGQ